MYQQEQVERGIALLDKKEPGWRARFNPVTLVMHAIEGCTLGQVFGNYTRGWRDLETISQTRTTNPGLVSRGEEEFALTQTVTADAQHVRIYPTELTEDVEDALRVPVPANEIKTLQHGGASIRYTEDKFVFDRLDEVVGSGNWEDHYTVTTYAQPVVHHKGRKDESLILGQVSCDLTVLGVTKGAVADMELTDDMYGTPATNAQARAVKRAAMKFGIARELWEKGTTSPSASGRSYPAGASRVSTKAPAGQSNGQAASGGATPGQISWLTKDIARGGFGFPLAVAKELSKQGASAVIDFLKPIQQGDDYETNPTPFIREALNKVAPDLVYVLDHLDDEDED